MHLERPRLIRKWLYGKYGILLVEQVEQGAATTKVLHGCRIACPFGHWWHIA